jgi:hypothetical protein
MQPHVRQVVDRFLEQLDQNGGATAVMLYGSGARGEHVEGRSDFNLLVIGPGFHPATLERLGKTFGPLEGKSPTPPLLFPAAEGRRSADVFPIEIADMQVARVTVRGPDPVAGLTVQRSDLRRALERELRGKLLRLRQGYAVHCASDPDLIKLGVQSAATMAALFRSGLVLLGDTPPIESPAMIARAAGRMGFDPEPLVRYFSLRTRREDGSSGERSWFERYLDATEKAVQFIDQFHVGGH